MQAIWLPPRATRFVDACEACADEPAARVPRMDTAMPAGALR